MDNVFNIDDVRQKKQGLQALAYLQYRTEQTDDMMQTLIMPVSTMKWFVEWFQHREGLRGDMYEYTGKMNLDNKGDIDVLREKVNIALEHENELYRKIAET